MKAENDFGLPSILLETVRRGSGLMVMTGVRGSGLDQAVDSLMKASGLRWVALENGSSILSQEADGVLLAQDPTVDVLRKFLSAIEEGRVGLLKMGAPSPLHALRRLLSLEFGEGRKHFVYRMIDQISILSGQMRVRSVEGSTLEEAREIILMTPSLKAALVQEEVEVAETLLKEGDESSGSVSFNQNLLQLLLRRRIDIKAAFEATRDPAHLDQILKKVGI